VIQITVTQPSLSTCAKKLTPRKDPKPKYEKRKLRASELTDVEEESYKDENSKTKTYKIRSFIICSTAIMNDEISVT
jgi:hypothetical protein